MFILMGIHFFHMYTNINLLKLINFLGKVINFKFNVKKIDSDKLKDLSLNNHPKWDSLAHVKLLSALEKKFKISTEFHDHRFTYFAQRIIYEEAPEVLPKSIFNEIHKSIANQILTLDNVNWFTIPKAYKQIDDLREKYKNENNLEKLDFLGEINDFLEKLQSIYEKSGNSISR